MPVGGYKQNREWEEGVKTGANASHSASHKKNGLRSKP